MIRRCGLLVLNSQKEFHRCYVRRSSNPGIGRQLKGLQNVTKNTSIVENVEEFDEGEPDFMNVHKTHKIYEKEMQSHKEKINFWMVKNKYFKKRALNFLTWSEKEQIRYLHEQNPTEWNVERLSDSFPADIFTITKIIKSNWMPQNEKRVQKHDLTVNTNWSKFRKDELNDIDPLLKEHLKKFSHRDFNKSNIPKINQKEFLRLHEPKGNEFSSIITSCKGYTEKKVDKEEIKLIEEPKPNKNATYLLKERRSDIDKRPTVFRDLKKETPINQQDDHQLVLHQQNNPSGTGTITVKLKSSPDLFHVKKFESHQMGKVNQRDLNVHPELHIKDTIKIPRKLWKRGATYQLDDCFYDDDGEFIYRVPGMTGKKFTPKSSV